MLKKILPHLISILAMMFLVFLSIDLVNEAMAFINNGITKGLLWVFSIAGILLSIIVIAEDRKRNRK